jgi:hypothetical protein
MEAGITTAINNVLVIARNISIAVCAAMFLVAGYQFLTSGGNPKGQETAKSTAYGATIGIAIIFASSVIANAIANAVRAVG